MPDTKVLDKSLGSRHRAALGITEETDAVVVVVSEERGTISFCFNGNIVSNLDGASLRQALLGLFGQRAREARRRRGAERAGTSRRRGTGSVRVERPTAPARSRRPSRRQRGEPSPDAVDRPDPSIAQAAAARSSPGRTKHRDAEPTDAPTRAADREAED